MLAKIAFLLALVAFAQAIKTPSKKQQLENAKKLLEVYSMADRTIEDEIMAQLEVFQQWMIEGNPELGIPVLDPFVVDHLEYGAATEDITFNVAIDGMHVTGLAAFTIAELDFNLLMLRIDATLNFQEVRLWADNYYLDGIMAGLLPLFGDGTIDITIHDLNITAGAALTTANDLVGIKNIELDVNFGAITGQIENLLGGDLDGVINDILNLLGPEIFESVETLVNADVSILLEEYINSNVLGNMTLDDLIALITGGNGFHAVPVIDVTSLEKNTVQYARQGNANDYLDSILANVREYLVDNGYANYTLPDQIEGFSAEWIGIEWHGEATLTDGFLAGLQTIHRVEDATLSVDGETGTISLNGVVEFFDLEAGYAMYVGFMDIGLDGEAAVTISSLKVSLAARLIVSSADSKAFTVVIDELNISNPGLVTVVFHGLGLLDFLLDGCILVTFLGEKHWLNMPPFNIIKLTIAVLLAAVANGEKAEVTWGLRQGNADLYLDVVLEEIANYLTSDGGVMVLPDFNQEFTETFLGIEWHGEAQLHNGTLTGLEGMHRLGDAFLVVEGDNSTISLSGAIEFKDMAAFYAMHVGIMGIWVDANAAVSISSVEVDLKLTVVVNPDTPKYFSIILEELSVVNPGEITIDFSGLGAIDFILDALGSVLVDVFQEMIFNSVEAPIQDAITAALGDNVDPNAYMDEMLTSVADLIISNGWDNYPLPDQVLGFSFEDFIGITWHAEAMLTNGFIAGLETIHRKENLNIWIDKETDAIKLETKLEFFDFEAGYNLYVGAMGIGIETSTIVTISKVEVYLRTSILVTDEPVGNSTSLTRGIQVSVDELGLDNPFFSISVDFDGLGLLDLVMDALIFVVVNVFEELIYFLIEGPIAEAIEQTIADLLPTKLLMTMLPSALLLN
ncbi:unnamed protein product [Notodromas monacha]|uniref:Uncharacterized protein n=1 Tax=Notodromas monacha TaxID=399045 RepID=A0A7R9BJU6_9CRUS|nr:unnamed protein product [Notodromas monacha]CAG0916794.1 unnamed protein product [Notodromas monacha]